MPRAGRRGLLFGLGLAALLLGGCLPREEAPTAALLVQAQPGQPAVVARVEGLRGDLYRWDWGDGTREEGASPERAHTYAALGVYTITVQVYRSSTSGSGLPGPGYEPGWSLVRELTAIVDLRPAVALEKIAVVALNPPYWYDPRRWPEDAYPAGCDLQLTPVLVRHRMDAPVPVRAVWMVFRDEQFQGQLEGLTAILPANQFFGPSCRTGRTPYRIHVWVFLSDGTLLEGGRVIYACPPSGCG